MTDLRDALKIISTARHTSKAYGKIQNRATHGFIFKITGETELRSLGIDSLDLVEIVMEAEEEFGIAFSNDELNNFTTVNDVVNAIKSKK